MANTFTSLRYHIVFTTKNRERWIDAGIEERVWAFLGGIARQNKMTALQVGGMPDHIHLLLGLGATMSVSEAVKLIKGGSSLWMKSEFEGKRGFAWQDGYGAFTVSASNVEEVAEYIRNQREHHRQRTFQEEYIAFLKKHGVSYDERYVFD